MILGHIGRGHEQHGLRHQTQLRDSPRPAAREDQIGRRIGIVHAVDEGPLPDIRSRMRRQERLHLALIIFARLPDHLHGSVRAFEREYPRLHHLVQRPRSERSAHDQHHRKIGRKAVIFQRFAPVGPLFRETAPQGIARHRDPARRKETLHPLIGDADALRTLGQNLVGQPGIGVLLLNHRRHAQPLRGPQHRGAGIAAESHDRIGPEFTNGLLGHRDALQHLERHREVVPVHTPLQARYGQSHDAVAQRGHLLHLHLALGAHEENLDPVAEPPFQRFRNSHGRIDMSARSAARKDDFPCHAILSFLLTINIFPPRFRQPEDPKARRPRQLKGPTAAPPPTAVPGDPRTRRSENRGAGLRPGQHSKASRLQNYEFFPFAALSSTFYRPQFPRSSER